MMRYLTLEEILRLHERVIEQSGGAPGTLAQGGLESAIAQPRMTFAGIDLYPTVFEKAAALAFSLISNHAFVDGNKRIGHAAMETFLVLNGHELNASVDEQEQMVLSVAAGRTNREAFTAWLASRVVERTK